MKTKAATGWNDVNCMLAEIREREKLIEKKNQKADEAHAKIDAKLEAETRAWNEEIDARKRAIDAFCRKHSAEFGGKAKKLEAGNVMLHEQVSLVIPDEAKTQDLLAKHYPDLLSVKLCIDRTGLKKLSDKELAKVKVERTVKTFCLIRTAKD